ncbi:anti-sigma factor [Trinickia terrae]|uniref:Anti-sigma factor n=1 Tax=Trinickia terrae TaxID=2571161 RepID=A0A4U1HQ62_9BURK|nr:anti-sigma factor [Trinickia terrae]TKC81664.1 anti-sigma factor [Trinickia terrae]
MNDDYDPAETSGFAEAELLTFSAFVDGELPEHERLEVLGRLAADARAASLVAAYRAQQAALRALCDTPSGAGGAARPYLVLRVRKPWWQRVAIAACWVAAGAGLAVLVGSLSPRLAWQPSQMAFAERADIAYAVYAPEKRHPVEVAAAEEEHLIAWLSKRLNRPLSVPSLQEYGYALVGGRLLPGDAAGPAAQFMYQDGSGARLTLYVTAIPKDETAFRLFRDGNRRTFYWVSDHMGYALSGQLSEERLRAIAIDVCSALGGRPDVWR